MQQDRINKRIDNYSINIKEVLWRLVLQWKCILIFALLTALVFALTQYYRASSILESENNTINELLSKTPQEIISELKPDEQAVVSSLYSMQLSKTEMANYIDDSILMDIDPYNTRLFTAEIIIDGEEGSIPSLVDAYNDLFKSDIFCNAINEAMGTSYAINQIRELVFTESAKDRNPSSKIAKCTICLPEGADGSKLKSAIEKQIVENKAFLTNVLGNYSIDVAFTEERVEYAKLVADHQLNVYIQLNNIENQINNLKNTLSPSQQNTYNTLLKYHTAKENAEEPEVHLSPRISKKYAILGFVIGIFVYAMIYVIYAVFRRKILDLSMIEEECGIRNFGMVEGSRNDNFINRAIYDPSLRKAGPTKTDNHGDRKRVVKEITTLCSNLGINTAVIVPDKRNQLKSLRPLLEDLAAEGIDTIVVSELEFEKEPEKAYGVILCIDDLTDTVKDVNKIIDDANRCDMKVIGFIYY